ncbi:hypothetical protein [Pseudalgibacter alginicilyticus]|nr:hypothetical protein [Pseudalgibacter alginicilyticus]
MVSQESVMVQVTAAVPPEHQSGMNALALSLDRIGEQPPLTEIILD